MAAMRPPAFAPTIFAFDHFAGFGEFLRLLPQLLLASFGEREFNVSFFAVERNDLCLELVAWLKVADRFLCVLQFDAENDARAKAAHVKIGLARQLFHEGDLDDVALFWPVGGRKVCFECLGKCRRRAAFFFYCRHVDYYRGKSEFGKRPDFLSDECPDTLEESSA